MLATLLKTGLAALLVLGIADYAIRETLVKPQAQQLFHSYLLSQQELVSSKPPKHFRIAHAGNALYAVCKTSNNCFDWNNYTNVDIVVASSPPGGPKSTVRLLRQCDIDRCEQTDHPDVVLRSVNEDESKLLATLDSSKHCEDRSIDTIYAIRICTEIQTLDGNAVYEIDQLLLEGQVLFRPFAERFSLASHFSADLVTSHRSYSDDIPVSIRGK